MSDTLEALRARVEAAQAAGSDRRWLVYIPDDGWSEHRNYDDAESEFDATAEALTDESADDGWAEDAESLCLMEARYLRNFRLVQTATAGDGTADGELCEERGHDYMARGVVDESTPPDLVTLAADLLAEVDRARMSAACIAADLTTIGAACDIRDDEYPLQAVRRVVDQLTAIRTALGNGADEAAWPPGMTMAEAVGRLREEHHSLRDVLQWVNDQCPGKCSGVCDAALRVGSLCGAVVREVPKPSGIVVRALCPLPAGHEGPHAEALGAGDEVPRG